MSGGASNANPRRRIVKLCRRQSPATVHAGGGAILRRSHKFRIFAQAARPRAVQHGEPGAFALVRLRVQNRGRDANRNCDAFPRRRIVKLCRRQSPANIRAGDVANPRRVRPVRSDIRRGAIAPVRPRIQNRRQIASRDSFANAKIRFHIRRGTITPVRSLIQNPWQLANCDSFANAVLDNLVGGAFAASSVGKDALSGGAGGANAVLNDLSGRAGAIRPIADMAARAAASA